MHKGNAESGPVEPSTQEAVDWYVHNELGTAFNAETLMQWDSWASNPRNRQEYAEVAEIRQQAPRRIEPPADATRGDLLADLESDLNDS
jgi:ferric-dicitrate binding protein FerR (iron transport regulator)